MHLEQKMTYDERITKYRRLLKEADSGPGTGHMIVSSNVWAEALKWALDELSLYMPELTSN